jgi:hypothetical protein
MRPEIKRRNKMATKNMTPEAASKMKPSSEKTSTTQDFKPRAQSSAAKKGK